MLSRRKSNSSILYHAVLAKVVFVNYSLTVTDDGKKALLTLANGDMRKVINILQSTSMAYPDVNEDTVYSCVGQPLRSDIANIVKWLLNEDFKTAYHSILLFPLLFCMLYENVRLFFLDSEPDIQELKVNKGLALGDILTDVHLYLHRGEFLQTFHHNFLNLQLSVELSPKIRVEILIKMASIEERLALGTEENVQLSSLVAAFQVAKEIGMES
jgi:replication factor C subunit 3/5